MNEKPQAQRIAETHAMARAFVEDMDFFRSTLRAKEPPAGFARHLSPLLRRLTSGDGELGKIAAPRVPKFRLEVPPIASIERANEDRPIPLFILGNAAFFGIIVSSIVMLKDDDQRFAGGALDPDDRIEVDMKRFLAQPCICYEGRWVTRKEVITYVAYVNNSVHSEAAEKHADWKLLDKIKYLMTAFPEDGQMTLAFEPNLRLAQQAATKSNLVTLPMIAAIAAVQSVITSPHVAQLEAIIRAESG